MATPRRPTKKRPLTPSSNDETGRSSKRGRGLFGNLEEEAAAPATVRPSISVDVRNLRSVNKAYALRNIRLPYSNTENVRVNFPANYESFAMAFDDAKMDEMNAVYPLYDSLEAFKAAPAPAIYVYGFFDTGFGALQVASYAEFLTRHTAVSRRKGASKVYAAGEIFKHGPTEVEYNVTSGTYSKELVDRRVTTTDELMEFVGGELAAAGFSAVPAHGAAATPGTFITAGALPVTNAEMDVFRRFGLTATKVAKTRRARRRCRKTRRFRR